MSKADERDEDKIRKGIGQAEYVKKGEFDHGTTNHLFMGFGSLFPVPQRLRCCM